MNRSIPAIVFGSFGGGVGGAAAAGGEQGTVKATSAADAAIQMAYANQVIVVPGYGLAVAQAQHAVKEMASICWRAKGVEVKYAIHPVAGRMPGHMNVLLAEADVEYDAMKEMDDINGEFGRTDVTIVIGANDVTNPAARNDPIQPDPRHADPQRRPVPLGHRAQALDVLGLRRHREPAVLPRPHLDAVRRRQEVRQRASPRNSRPCEHGCPPAASDGPARPWHAPRDDRPDHRQHEVLPGSRRRAGRPGAVSAGASLQRATPGPVRHLGPVHRCRRGDRLGRGLPPRPGCGRRSRHPTAAGTGRRRHRRDGLHRGPRGCAAQAGSRRGGRGPRGHPGQSPPSRERADDHRQGVPGEGQRQHRDVEPGSGDRSRRDGVGDPLGRRHHHGSVHRPATPMRPGNGSCATRPSRSAPCRCIRPWRRSTAIPQR